VTTGRRESVQIGVTLGHAGETIRDTQQFSVVAEQAGLDLIGIGDTISRDVYCELTACALATSRISLGTTVTNPVTRLPAITARALSSLDELTGGRSFLGIGLGQSGVASLGHRRASVPELSAALDVIRQVAGTSAAEDGTPGVSLDWAHGRWPVIVHASGPRTCDIAVKQADGIMIRFGDRPEDELEAFIASLRTRRQALGIADPFQVWLYAPVIFERGTANGARELAGVVSARAMSAPAETFPAEVADRLALYRSRYDYRYHSVPTEPRNFDLLMQLGLDEYMVSRFSLAGSISSVVDRLRQLHILGIDAVIVTGAVPDKAHLLDGLGTVRRGLTDRSQG
jgi:5,10-methylenetetrahydromethanopterin reductase